MTSSKKPDSSRRQFLNRLAVASASLPVIVLLGNSRTARAEEAAHMNPDDPMAKALKYVEDAAVRAEGRVDESAALSELHAIFWRSRQGMGSVRHLPGQTGQRQWLVHSLG